MHRRHAQQICDLRLNDRKMERPVAGEADGLKAGVDFTDQQGGPFQRLLTAQRQQPFAVHGGVHHRLQPQQSRQMRMLLGQGSQTIVRGLCDKTISQRANTVIDPLQHEAMQVDEISGNVDLRILTPPIAQVAIPRAEPADDQAGMLDQGVLGDDVAARRLRHDMGQYASQGLPLVLGEVVATLQLLLQQAAMVRHGMAPLTLGRCSTLRRGECCRQARSPPVP